MIFTFFLLDPRPFGALRQSLDEMLGGGFVEDQKSKADGRHRYINYVFGLNISCSYEETWTEGPVYRMSGVNAAGSYFAGAEEVDMAFHVFPLLSNAGCLRVMTLEEFRDDPRRRTAYSTAPTRPG